MSLVQSCKELGISPLAYLRDLMARVAQTPASANNTLTPRGYRDSLVAAARSERARQSLSEVLAGLTFRA
jgi:hypothetical protein